MKYSWERKLCERCSRHPARWHPHLTFRLSPWFISFLASLVLYSHLYIFPFIFFLPFPPLPSPVWDVSDTSGNILKSWSRLRRTLRAFWVSRTKKHKNSLPASRLYIGLTLVARRHKVKSLFCSKERRQYDRLKSFVKEGMYRKSRQSAASEAIFIDDLITRFVSRTEFVCVRVRCFRAMTDKHCFVSFNNPYLKVAL